jgi:TatD DNase family protein
VSNFVFPASWRSIPTWLEQSRVYSTIGIHPNLCSDRLIVRDHVEDLLELSRHPKVVGWGELGLDYFRQRGNNHRILQRRNLDLLLQIRPKHLPLVIHCREQSDDSTEATIDLLEALKGTTSRDTPIMLHCFTGGPKELGMFQTHYKEIYISVSILCLHVRDEKR